MNISIEHIHNGFIVTVEIPIGGGTERRRVFCKTTAEVEELVKSAFVKFEDAARRLGLCGI